jgi:polar amino acid transport system substrate-binding protein
MDVTGRFLHRLLKRSYLLLVFYSSVISAVPTDNSFKITAPDIAAEIPYVENNLLKAYQKIGVNAEIIRLPTIRSLATANYSDWVDAELARAEELAKTLVDYIMIPTPLLTLTMNSYGNNANQCFPTWESLTSTKVAFLRGFLSIKSRLLNHKIQFMEVETNEQAVAMLQASHVAAIIISENLLSETLKARLDNNKMHCMREIEVTPLYHFIRKRHQAIVPQLTKAIKESFTEKIIN